MHIEILKGQTDYCSPVHQIVISYIRRQGGTKTASLLKLSKCLLFSCHQVHIVNQPLTHPGALQFDDRQPLPQEENRRRVESVSIQQ